MRVRSPKQRRPEHSTSGSGILTVKLGLVEARSGKVGDPLERTIELIEEIAESGHLTWSEGLRAKELGGRARERLGAIECKASHSAGPAVVRWCAELRTLLEVQCRRREHLARVSVWADERVLMLSEVTASKR